MFVVMRGVCKRLYSVGEGLLVFSLRGVCVKAL